MIKEELIKRAAEDIVSSRRTVALTGAGISTESGIPDFRGPHGIWKKYDPSLFTYSRFLRNPKEFWEVMVRLSSEIFNFTPKPNPAHYALAKLEELGLLRCIITQNVDGLHQEAGSKNVIEFHGNLKWAKCIGCNAKYPLAEIEEKVRNGEIPPKCPSCSSILKPDCVFFEEPIPADALVKAEEEAKACDLMIVAGTSAVVYPAAGLPFVAKTRLNFSMWSSMFFSLSDIIRRGDFGKGAKIIEVNAEPTPLTGIISDYIIEGKCGEILPKIVEEVERKLKKK